MWSSSMDVPPGLLGPIRNSKMPRMPKVKTQDANKKIYIGQVSVNEEEDVDNKRFIGQVGSKKWSKLGRGEITIDSAAEESVCPKDWANAYPTKPVKGKPMRFINASGDPMGHFGTRTVNFQTTDQTGESKLMGMGFEVSDVKKPLAAVHRIAERGNIVQFGPRAKDNYIMNIATGEKIAMKKKGRSYVLEVDFVVDQKESAEGFGRRV